MQNKYQVRYLPLFELDFAEIIDYIAYDLRNPQAAKNLIDKVEAAIFKRLTSPEAYEPYNGKRRTHTYYRIYVDNFVIYYVVIDHVMEVRRILYKRRNREKI